MAQANTHTTFSDLSKGYKKKATKLYTAFKAMNEEWSWVGDIDDEDITPGRENLIPLNIKRGYGAAMIPDGGYEARTVTPAMNEGSFDFVEASARFFISRRSRAMDSRAAQSAIIKQVKYSSMKCFEAISRRVSLQFYGFPAGTVAVNQTDATATSGQAYTLADAYGVAALDNAAYIASLFDVGDGVGLIDGTSLVTNGLGVITAVTAATPSITVTWGGSVDADVGDFIVFANAVTDTTVTATDQGRWPVGLLDAITSTTVHGLATSSEANWAPALNNSDGGRFNFVKLKKMRQALHNRGSADLTDIVWSNGVENDVEEGERAARMYSSSAMDLDVSVKAKGVKFHTSALVPPGEVIGWDRDAIGKKDLTDRPDENGVIDFGEMDKAEDRAGWKGGLHMIYARVIRNRAGLARYSALDEQ